MAPPFTICSWESSFSATGKEEEEMRRGREEERKRRRNRCIARGWEDLCVSVCVG
jgi:hypothetical protein